MRVISVFVVILIVLIVLLSCDPGRAGAVYYSIDISTQPSGVGVVTTDPEKEQYPEGEKVTLTALPADDYIFDHWDGDIAGTDNPGEVTMNSNKKIVAVYREFITYELSVSEIPVESGTITVNPDQEYYESNATITLQGTPNLGCAFLEWEINGSPDSTDNPYSFTIEEDTTVVGYFEQLDEYTLTINLFPTATCAEITVDPDLPAYYPGMEITLEAFPDRPYRFDEWGILGEDGETTITDNPCTFTMQEEHTVVEARCEPLQSYTITLNYDPDSDAGSVLMSPRELVYYEGELVTVMSVPAYGYLFDFWSGDLTGTTNLAEFTVDSDKTITAHFVVNTNPDIAFLVDVENALEYVGDMILSLTPEELPDGITQYTVPSAQGFGSDDGECIYRRDNPAEDSVRRTFLFNDFTVEGPVLLSPPGSPLEIIKTFSSGIFVGTKVGEVTVDGTTVIFDINIYDNTPVSGEYIINGQRYNTFFEPISKRRTARSILDWFF